MHQFQLIAAIGTIFTLSIPSQSLCGEFADWHALPHIENIFFTKETIGLTSKDGRMFLLGRKTSKLQQTPPSRMKKLFSKQLQQKPSQFIDDRKRNSRYYLLRASDGNMLTTEHGYCGEGARDVHGLLFHRKRVRDYVEPCNSISTVEIVDDRLWIGTFIQGELGSWPAEGILVQQLDTDKLLGRIRSQDGLTGNFVYIIRKDPHTDDIWVATHLGINRISKQFKVLESAYFYEDFDLKTKVPKVRLHPRPKKTNPFAVASRLIAVKDKRAFYLAVQRIPDKLHELFCLDILHSFSSALVCDPRNAKFLPKEFNVLLPFVFEALQSSDEKVRHIAQNLVCNFRHKCVVEYLISEHNDMPHWQTDSCHKRHGLKAFRSSSSPDPFDCLLRKRNSKP